MAWAVADRELHVADPRFVDIPTGALTDKQYAAKAREVVADRADTTQVCVVDDGGNVVSLTHTLGSSSGVVTPGLGFGYNDYMNCFDPRPGRPNSVRPGKTRVTMMPPTMVFDRGKLRACAGARSEERRVGKEGRWRRARASQKQKQLHNRESKKRVQEQ